jgi:hypothetical protein
VTGRLFLSFSHHNVFCFSPHSLQMYATRTCPRAAETRFGAPHFPHLVSMRVGPCLTVTVFRSNASFTKRSVSSRIACFDILCLLLAIPNTLRAVVNVGNEHFAAAQPGLFAAEEHGSDIMRAVWTFLVVGLITLAGWTPSRAAERASTSFSCWPLTFRAAWMR